MKKTNRTSNKLIQSCFWQHQVEKNEISELLFGNIFARTINKSTKFLYIAFVDENKNIFRTGWSAYDSAEKLFGFIEHIYLPTLLLNWYDHQSLEFYVPMSSIDVIKDALDEYIEVFDGYEYITNLNTLISRTDLKEDLSILINCIEKGVNQNFKTKSKIAYIKIFENLKAVNQYLKEEIPFEEVFVEEMGISNQAFDEICETIEVLPLLNRVLVSQLNQKMSIVGF